MSDRRRPLPPGQRETDGFPRFGTHFHLPPPPIPAEPAIEVVGAVTEPFSVPLTRLASLPREEREADFHCVAGWSSTGLRWEGVPFAAFYREVVAPAVRSGPPITHLSFGGYDGYRSIARLEDVLAEDVLIAEGLDGRPLDSDHGAPARLVSPQQYGFISTKHLSRIELHTEEPDEGFGFASTIARIGFSFPGFGRHDRARVWQEERHPTIPGRTLRPFYRLIVPVIRSLSARGSRSADDRET